MNILAIGDFHGKFPMKLKKLAKSADIILSVGDYPSWRLRKTFFEHSYKRDKEVWEIVGKKEYKKKTLLDWKDAEKVLKRLDSFGIPVLTTLGNYDNSGLHDAFDVSVEDETWNWAEQDFFSVTIKKYPRVKRIDYKVGKFRNLIFTGALGHSFPGNVKSKSYKKHRKKLDKFFGRYSEENKEGRVIFINHTAPYDTSLDKIRDKEAPEIVKGKHYGSKLFRRIIDRYQPSLAIGGHFHENQGKCKIGKTLVVNPGAAMDGKCAVIDFDAEKGKVKSVKFIN